MSEFVERTAYYSQGPVALIIGCGDLGMGCARALGRRHPLLIVDIDRQRLDAAIQTLRHEGYAASGRTCDITDAEQTKALGDALSGGPGVRVLAHIAAIGGSNADWRQVLAVDLFGPHLIAQAVGPHMVRGAAAIFVGSLASYLCAPDPRVDAVLADPLKPGFFDELQAIHGSVPSFFETYSYAKLGVSRLAEQLAIAWARNEVRAISVSPGMLNTTIGRVEGATLPSHQEGVPDVPRLEKIKEIPLGREGSILEAVDVISFLASDAASFLTGIDVPLDGGHRALWRSRGLIGR